MTTVNPHKYKAAQSLIASGYWAVQPEQGLIIGPSGRFIGSISKGGYVRVEFVLDHVRLRVLSHRVIWESVNGAIPPGLQINHLNGVKTDNRIANLEAVSGAENIRHAYRTGLNSAVGTPGVGNGRSKLSDAAVADIYTSQSSAQVMAEKYGISVTRVFRIRRNEGWTHITTHLVAPIRRGWGTPSETVDVVCQRLRNGDSYRSICDDLRLNYRTVIGIAERHGLSRSALTTT